MADLGQWTMWWVLGAAVVVIAATLLITILFVARAIERHARRALKAAQRIEANTAPSWGLVGALGALESARGSIKAAEARSRGEEAGPGGEAQVERMGR